jgi:hypothetical protein
MNKVFTRRTVINTGKSFMDYYLCINNKAFKALVDDNVYNVKHDLGTNITVPSSTGRVYKQSRNISFYSYNNDVNYKYADKLIDVKPITFNLNTLFNYINTMFNSDFNSVLISKYNNGMDYVGKHTYDDNHLSKNGIVTLSYGRRDFYVHNIRNNRLVATIETHNYSLIHTYGDYHTNYVNEIVKNIKRNNNAYTFTFCKNT